MGSTGFGEGVMVVLYIVELIVVVLGVRWAIRTHRRIGELERTVSFLQGRAGAPSATRSDDRPSVGVYDLGRETTTVQRPARRP